MKRFIFLVLSAALFYSCADDQEDVSIDVFQGRAIEEGPAELSSRGSKSIEVIGTAMTTPYSASSLAQRSCAGTAAGQIGPVVTEARALNSATADCNPLDIMTPNFRYMMGWSNYEVPAGTTARFGQFGGSGDPNEYWVQEYLTNHMQGLNNEGYPPPVAPGTTITWVNDVSYQIMYLEEPDGNGDYPHLGSGATDVISTADLEYLRDQLSCEVLDIYFDEYYGNTASDGYGYLIGEVQVEALQSFCSSTRLLFVTVTIGHNVYTAPDFPDIN